MNRRQTLLSVLWPSMEDIWGQEPRPPTPDLQVRLWGVFRRHTIPREPQGQWKQLREQFLAALKTRSFLGAWEEVREQAGFPKSVDSLSAWMPKRHYLAQFLAHCNLEVGWIVKSILDYHYVDMELARIQPCRIVDYPKNDGYIDRTAREEYIQALRDELVRMKREDLILQPERA